jgi:hypothetical protein
MFQPAGKKFKKPFLLNFCLKVADEYTKKDNIEGF